MRSGRPDPRTAREHGFRLLATRWRYALQTRVYAGEGRSGRRSAAATRSAAAATVSGLPPGSGSVAIVVAVAIVIYAFSCWRWPFADCLKCGGSGKIRNSSGKVFKICKRCKGSAKRLRVGRRAWNRFRGIRERGTQ